MVAFPSTFRSQEDRDQAFLRLRDSEFFRAIVRDRFMRGVRLIYLQEFGWPEPEAYYVLDCEAAWRAGIINPEQRGG